VWLSMSVHRFLVTGSDAARMTMWAQTCLYTNWIEGRPNQRGGETWLVTVWAEQVESVDHFLDAARDVSATVEEIEGAGDEERYLLRVGSPGTGWVPHEDEGTP
jgi:hypothetical protein